MMEDGYHVTTQNRFYPDMSNVIKNITVESKLISPPTYFNKKWYSCLTGYNMPFYIKNKMNK